VEGQVKELLLTKVDAAKPSGRNVESIACIVFKEGFK
jgi:hypothetical protein